MAEGVSGGPARSYRRRSLAEQREAFQIATAEIADWGTEVLLT